MGLGLYENDDFVIIMTKSNVNSVGPFFYFPLAHCSSNVKLMVAGADSWIYNAGEFFFKTKLHTW